MPKPLIGITTYRFFNSQHAPQLAINEAYSQALIQAGAAPVLIPLGLPEDALTDMLSRLDGVLFSGGGDVQPESYGSQPHPLVDGVDADRDRVEIFLARQITQTPIPFIGICRGLQVVNVALGGSLYEDILEQHTGAQRHQWSSDHPRNYLAHAVTLNPTSRVAAILGKPDIEVNSLHHQGINRLAPNLRAVAHAPDGIIEAIELPGHPFGLAVQWHPEWLQEHAPMRQFFQAFVQAAANQKCA